MWKTFAFCICADGVRDVAAIFQKMCQKTWALWHFYTIKKGICATNQLEFFLGLWHFGQNRILLWKLKKNEIRVKICSCLHRMGSKTVSAAFRCGWTGGKLKWNARTRTRLEVLYQSVCYVVVLNGEQVSQSPPSYTALYITHPPNTFTFQSFPFRNDGHAHIATKRTEHYLRFDDGVLEFPIWQTLTLAAVGAPAWQNVHKWWN